MPWINNPTSSFTYRIAHLDSDSFSLSPPFGNPSRLLASIISTLSPFSFKIIAPHVGLFRSNTLRIY